MSTTNPTTTKQITWALDSVALRDAYTDFFLSRQAMNATPATLKFYGNTAGKFLSWGESQGVTGPEQVTARIVRQYLASLADRKLSDKTLHAHARAIKTMLLFWHGEGYIQQAVKFDMPIVVKKRLPRVTAEQLREVIKKCNTRDKAIILLMVDSGLRRAEVCALNWSDVDMQTGAVTVTRGKGRKGRISRIGATTRRALLRYAKTTPERNGPVFLNGYTGERLTGNGLRLVFRRLSQRVGITITPHAMRRTWTLLSLRAGMDPIHLKLLGGWTDLKMVEYYAGMEDEDLLKAHKEHSPVDSL